MPGSATKRNTANFVAPMPSDTSANWANNTKNIPAGLAVRDSSLGRIKIGDGTKTFAQLPWAVEASLPTEYRVLLDKLFETSDGGLTYNLKIGQNIPESMILSDATGKIRHDQLPGFILNTVKVVETYGDLLALDVSFHQTMVLVVDATNGTVTGGGEKTAGDPTVDAGAAIYVWYDPDGSGALPQSWNKVTEIGSLDVNWTLQLQDHFKFRGANANTLDDIIDGATYGKMTKAEITRLSTVETNADVTDYDNVQAANAIMYDHKVVCATLGAAELDAILDLPV